jgi:hypothetical protein
MVNGSIGNSDLLITRTWHRHKHQLRDFFNSHRRYRNFPPLRDPTTQTIRDLVHD